MLEKDQGVRMSALSHYRHYHSFSAEDRVRNIGLYCHCEKVMQLSLLYRHLLGPDYTETYYSPRGEEITKSPQIMVGSECSGGPLLQSAAYIIRFIVPRKNLLKNQKT